MFKGKGWFGGGIWKPKNPHSLDHLKYLYNILSKNQTVTEQNKSLLVETLRSIAEILIWGDQNDSTVFETEDINRSLSRAIMLQIPLVTSDVTVLTKGPKIFWSFFLEKSMLSFFLKIMKQKCGRYVCIQLLQTLNILFENIRNETSLYYLLSNNHVNSIIVHKFDFSDEEVMAYYISFLKTLSLKLNTHTIHFFYNEVSASSSPDVKPPKLPNVRLGSSYFLASQHTHDFPLYTEAIKFFNHSESMVRIAVRTLTLNVYKVDDKSMLKFIRDKTAAPYFSNLVWFIGSHVLELDSCVRNDADHQSRNRLSDLVAEHLDHLHYLNDILCLQIESLNDVLTDHLLNRLLVPLYVYSLTKRRRLSQLEDDKPHVSSVVSLFLLSQVFLILSHVPLVRQLADIILNRDTTTFTAELSQPQDVQSSRPGFAAPLETLEKSLENQVGTAPLALDDSSYSLDQVAMELAGQDAPPLEDDCFRAAVSTDDSVAASSSLADMNITDEEKQLQQKIESTQQRRPSVADPLPEEFSLNSRPYLEAVFNALECSENDYAALFTLCLLYALGHNQGINQELLDAVLMPTDRSETKHWYNVNLVERLIKIISASCQYNSKVRLATLELSLLLLKQLVLQNGRSFLQDRHLAAIEGAREESTLLLRNFYKSEEIFLDMFEDEYREMKKKALNVEYLTMDANILLPPTGTPLTGIEFYKRLPCGEVERARRTIRVFFLLRDLSLALRMEPETQLPLTNPQACVQVGDVLDLNNSDLIACTVISKESHKIRRFLVIDVLQLILVEPDTKRLGWGVAKFVGFLQDIEVTGDKDDSRCLHVTVHRPLSSAAAGGRVPLLSAKFVFDDHIRCMAAKQRLTKGRLKARQRKMHLMARLLELPGNIQPCPSPPLSAVQAVRHQDSTRKRMHRSMSHEQGMRLRNSTGSQHRPIFVAGNKVPGFAAMMRHEETAASSPSTSESSERSRRSSGSPGRYSRSREGSPRLHPNSGTSEEIPLEDMSQTRSPRSRRSSPSHRRSAPNLPTPRLTCSSQQWPSEGTSYTSTVEPVSPSPEKVRSSKGRKPRSLSESCAPKTLRPPDAPTLSLLESTSALNNLGVACLLPPSATELATPEVKLRETSFFDPPLAAQEVDDNSLVDHCGNSNSPVIAATDVEENQVGLTAEEDEPVKVKGAVLTV